MSSRDLCALMRVAIASFGYRHGAPPQADVTFDLREHYRNPGDDARLRYQTGMDEPVRAHVLATAGIPELIQATARTAADLVRTVGDPTHKLIRVAVGCAGGRHRSVVVADELAETLIREYGVGADVDHRDIARPVLPLTPVDQR